MGYLCIDCYKEFNKRIIDKSEFDNNDRSICPTCGGTLAYIDDLILPIIQILNRKGYRTTFSCSGHSYYEFDYYTKITSMDNKIYDPPKIIPIKVQNPPNTYISFQSEYMPKIIPDGFNIESKVLNRICIRKHYSETNENQIHKEILQTMLELFEWAENLEKCS